MSGPGVGGWCAWFGGRGGVSGLGGGLPQCLVGYPPPPVNRMTNRCKNITLATTSLRPVKMIIYQHLWDCLNICAKQNQRI